MARQDAGRLPEVHLDGYLQDHQPAQRSDARGRRRRLPPGLRPELQRDSSLPRRLARRPGPVHGQDGRGEADHDAGLPRGSDGAPRYSPGGASQEGQQKTFSSLAEARNGRPRTLTGVTKKIRTGHGSMYVTMNDDEFGPRECFVILGKPGGTAAAFSDALGRMITMALTHGASPAEVVHQLRGIQDGHPAGVGPNAVLSVPDGVARAMSENYLIEDSLPDTRELPVIGACPDCGSGLTRQEGCVVCHSCGYSKCS